MGRGVEAYDYIIAGGGTAGCLLANRLTRDPATRVLMVEAGGSGRHPYVEVPLALPRLIGNPRFDWCYQTEPEPHCHGRRIFLPRGRMLGGSSGINGMVYVRGHRYDYDSWAAQGNAGWSWADVLPYFMRSEGFDGPDLQAHGTTGEWRISDPGVRWEALDAYHAAAVEAGIPATDDYNSGENEGVQYFQALVWRGTRQSAAKAFLRPVERRPNLTVVTGAAIDRVTVEGGRATELVYRADGAEVTATARREVLLCAGAYGSPVILERSGIGDPERLAALGLPVVHALAGVGKNLLDHWHIRVRTRLSGTKTLNDRARTLLGKALMGADYVFRRKGPMSAQPPLLTAFTRLFPDAPAPDIQLVLSAASYERVGAPMDDFPGITSSACIMRPESTGHVHATSADPMAAPAILHNYLAEEYDREIAVRAVELVRRIVGSPAMARFRPENVAPGAHVQTRDEILDYARSTLATTFHPVGTCKMGQGPDAVVDARLRVHGIGGLRVVDASIMPTIPSGNTCAPVVMIAEKASDLILEDAGAAVAA